MFDKYPYGTETTAEVLKIVKNLKLGGYTFLENRKGNKENFFIWKKGNQEYLRLILVGRGWHEKRLYYWNLEFSFKPFNYKHNHQTESHWQSEEFKGTAEDLYFNRFLEAVKQIKQYTDRLRK